MRVLVIGGTLFIGKLLVKRLLAADHDVTILHRKAEHPFGRRVRNAVADRNDAKSIRDALDGYRFEAVYDIAYDNERGTTAAQVEATAKSIPGDLTRYIFMSSVAAYGDGLNHSEDDPLASDIHNDSYVRNKASSERALFRMYHESRFPLVTIRPTFVYGPDNPFYREAFFWDRLRHDRPIIIPGDGNRLMQFVYVNDLVEACFNALEKHTAPGRAFNVADEKPLTQVEVVMELAKAMNKQPEIIRAPREIIARNGGNAFAPPLYFGQYYDLPPITEAVGRVKRVLNVSLTPFSVGLKETWRWYSKHTPERKLDFSFEDKVIRQAREYAKNIHHPV
ncbi:MAG TPA: NAD-dependent epimerase/dehydratase family protein [Bryobacteraceae bacterium]|jgi:nucleoside-diphosphate-sugar epimerase|nr:NAD-dependent epimerase/dehydratase family protein [Bryobacteraceae bacterium]